MASSCDNSSPLDQRKAIQDELVRGKEVVALLGNRPQVPELIDPLVHLLNGTFDRLLSLVGSPNSVVTGSPSSDEGRSENSFGRGSCRKRISPSPWSQVTSKTTNDGYKWRKYGQKRINGFTYPRSYFYCYHKDQGCKAARQVQRTNEDSSLFVITYLHKHTCKQVAPQTQTPSYSSSLKEESTISFGSIAYNNITQAHPPQLSSSFPSEFTSEGSMLRSQQTDLGFASDNGEFEMGTYEGSSSGARMMGSVSDYNDTAPAGLSSSFGSLDSLMGLDLFDYMDEGTFQKDYDEATMFNFDEGDFSHPRF